MKVKHRKVTRDLLCKIKYIQETFREHDARTVQEWAESLLTPGQPGPDRDPEILVYTFAATAYSSVVQSNDPFEVKQELFRLVEGCITSPRELVLSRRSSEKLGRVRADEAIGSFYGQAERMGMLCEHGYVIIDPGVHNDVRLVEQLKTGIGIYEGRNIPCIKGSNEEPPPIRSTFIYL